MNEKPSLIPYLELGDSRLNVHVFRPATEAEGMFPAILFYFGGGWNKGTPEQFYPQCRHLASKGWLATVAEYRTRKSHDTPPWEAVKDARAAMRRFRSWAVEQGADPHRVWAGGGSAGAHLAASCAMESPFEHEGQDVEQSTRPDGLILFNPVIDNSSNGYGYERVKSCWRDFSPMHAPWVGPPPPALVMLGDQDCHIPVSTGEAFCARLAELGGVAELKVYPDQPHGFFNFREGDNPWYQETLADMTAFLETHAGA